MSADRYRVVVEYWQNGRQWFWYAEPTGERLKCGFPLWSRTDTKRPQELWTSRKDARDVKNALRRKPGKFDAHVVEEISPAGELQLRHPTGETA